MHPLRPYPAIDFSVVPLGFVIVVTIFALLIVGLAIYLRFYFGQGNARAEMRATIAAQEAWQRGDRSTPPPTHGFVVQAAPVAKPVEEKLRDLDRLLAVGTITPEQHARLRAEIIGRL